jgi:hypothetical protein
MGQKPQYVIRINGGYYSSSNAWKTVDRALATRMDHKAARAMRGRLKRLGYAATVEPACNGFPATLATDGPTSGVEECPISSR